MNNRFSKQELVELWNTTQRMLKNPVSECFNGAELERFAEQHWRCGERSLDLLVQVQADWLRLAMRSLALNGSQATAMQHSAQNWGFWPAQFLQLQQAAWVQWRNTTTGLNPLSLASISVSEKAWQDLATSWQQGAQKILRTQQNLVSTLARARGKASNLNRDVPAAETPSGQRTAA
ncbi:MAG: hypothetical protein ACREVK_03360 [Gammaproteobacteria bacterium]